MIRIAHLVCLSLALVGCAQSDEELCKDVQEKLTKCGTNGPGTCPEGLADKVREQYECIMDTNCQDIARECT